TPSRRRSPASSSRTRSPNTTQQDQNQFIRTNRVARHEKGACREGGRPERTGWHLMSTVQAGPGRPARLQAGIRTPEGISFLRALAGTRVRQNGCAAAAYAALFANVDVITA